jgi:DnaK suppressor protein
MASVGLYHDSARRAKSCCLKKQAAGHALCRMLIMISCTFDHLAKLWYILASTGTPGNIWERIDLMTSVIDQQDLDVVKLQETRQELLEDIEALRRDLRSMAEPSADEADVDAYEREKTWALIQRLQAKLESVEHAIHAAQRGTYGICESCGQAIDPARLDILPETTMCLDCQRQFERRLRRHRL